MHAVPFMLVGQRALDAVQAALARAACGWAEQWGVELSQVSVVVERAWEAVPPANADAIEALHWRHQVRHDAASAWFGFSADLTAELQKAIFGAVAAAPGTMEPASIAPAGAGVARDALFDALARAALGGDGEARGEPGAIPHSTWKRGGGGVLAHVAIGSKQCRVLLNGAAVQGLLPPGSPLPGLRPVDYRACVADVPVTLQLTAGSARVRLGGLLALAEGDVIGLATRSDAPVSLCTLAGQPLLDGYLGRSGDKIAVELSHLQSYIAGASHA